MAKVVQTEVDKILAADPEQRPADLDTLHDAFIPWLATTSPDNDQPMRRLARDATSPADVGRCPSGGTIRAFEQLLAGRRLTQTPDDGPLVNALLNTVTLIQIADTGSPAASVVFSPA